MLTASGPNDTRFGSISVKVMALGACACTRLAITVAEPLTPAFMTLGDVDSAEALEAYQAAKRAQRSARRAEAASS